MSAERPGLDDRLRIGVLVPSSNTVMENDLHQALKSRYTVHTARMYLEETTAAAERKMVEKSRQPPRSN